MNNNLPGNPAWPPGTLASDVDGPRRASEPDIARIAKEHLGIETLETRNRDRLDFHDLAVANIKKALKEAYEAGQRSV